MLEVLFQAIYIFLVVLELLLFIYIMSSWFPFRGKIRELLLVFLAPLLDPIRYLLKHSCFYTRAFDLSPMIAFFIIIYLQQFFLGLN